MTLDDEKNYAKLDHGQVAKSIEVLPDQIRQVLEESRLIKIPREYSQCAHVVINGMGGSNLGARIIKALFADQIKVPILISPGYGVPAYVGKSTLYIISSYSGSTEEPLSTYQVAKKKGAKIMAITMHSAKNPLEKLMLKDDIPGYIFTPQFNPSNQPRLGVGYTIFGTMVMMAKAGLFKIDVKEIEDIIGEMEIWGRGLKPVKNTKTNPAKKIAQTIWGRIPVLVGAEFLQGNLHVMRNQINECAKQFSTYLSLPELNHYAMESLNFPTENKDNLIFFFLKSKLYSPRILKRLDLTKRVVEKNKIVAFEYELRGQSKIAQGFELLQLGSWVSYYLGMLNGVDPVKIPWVDWFKEQLK